MIPFKVYEEQAKILEAASRNKNILILKSRQIGCSQICCFLDALYVILNPGSKVAIVADTEQKVHGLLDRARQVLDDLKIPQRISNRSKIVTQEGSEIHAVTANAAKGQSESKAGRSMSFQLLHLSELAFWPDQNAYGALVSSAGLSAPIMVESTSSGPGDLMWKLWSEKNDFEKLFFSVEDHAAYVSTPSFTEEEWREMQDLGFTRAESAAWFLKTLRNRFQGDLVRALREYPQKPEHAFMSSEGRWINLTPPVLDHTMQQEFKIFQNRIGGEEYVIGVDTAGGLGQDASAIAVIRKSDMSIVASWCDETATVDTLADMVRIMYTKYGGSVIIESNGIGLATVQATRARGVPVVEWKTSKSTQYQGLLAVKRAVEEGRLSGPIELAEECDSLHVNRYEKFDGKKDLCMAIGFCYLFADKNPQMPKPIPEPGPEVFNIARYFDRPRTGTWSDF
tara:strand:- start:2674 stop:4032 length:1359 start_codon:yes stop_codon:yes gene_type:complete